jgi:hypothetical protein
MTHLSPFFATTSIATDHGFLGKGLDRVPQATGWRHDEIVIVAQFGQGEGPDAQPPRGPLPPRISTKIPPNVSFLIGFSDLLAALFLNAQHSTERRWKGAPSRRACVAAGHTTADSRKRRHYAALPRKKVIGNFLSTSSMIYPRATK